MHSVSHPAAPMQGHQRSQCCTTVQTTALDYHGNSTSSSAARQLATSAPVDQAPTHTTVQAATESLVTDLVNLMAEAFNPPPQQRLARCRASEEALLASEQLDVVLYDDSRRRQTFQMPADAQRIQTKNLTLQMYPSLESTVFRPGDTISCRLSLGHQVALSSFESIIVRTVGVSSVSSPTNTGLTNGPASSTTFATSGSDKHVFMSIETSLTPMTQDVHVVDAGQRHVDWNLELPRNEQAFIVSAPHPSPTLPLPIPDPQAVSPIPDGPWFSAQSKLTFELQGQSSRMVRPKLQYRVTLPVSNKVLLEWRLTTRLTPFSSDPSTVCHTPMTMKRVRDCVALSVTREAVVMPRHGFQKLDDVKVPYTIRCAEPIRYDEIDGRGTEWQWSCGGAIELDSSLVRYNFAIVIREKWISSPLVVTARGVNFERSSHLDLVESRLQQRSQSIPTRANRTSPTVPVAIASTPQEASPPYSPRNPVQTGSQSRSASILPAANAPVAVGVPALLRGANESSCRRNENVEDGELGLPPPPYSPD
ncbi:hypothetical protein OIV83_005405 [Microbotryomycetes sp. JL201]|nr:hypothetical protein OIV83_005405 [Microbotryomycetes sp. JL201]